MGLTFRKSISLPGGFRINLSKSGVGASWGVKGLRVGTGPRGPRLNAYIPGTGLGWTTSLGGGARKAERPPSPPAPGAPASLQSARERSATSDDRERAAQAVAAYEARIASLTSLHREVSRPLDWPAIAGAPAPAPPPGGSRREQAALEAQAAYQPSTTDRVLGGEARQREALAAAVERAREEDRAEYQARDPAHQAEHARWSWWHHLAQGIHDGDLDAYDAVLEHVSPLRQLTQLGASIEASARSPWLGEARLHANGREVVPAEVLALTKTGKLSSRKLAAARAIELYQDHLCSAAFRVARELFAALPFELVLVHVRTSALDTATGHDTEQTVLSAAFSREEMEKIDFSRIDPSDALERFPHAMKLSPRTGLSPVEEIALEDLPVDHGEAPLG